MNERMRGIYLATRRTQGKIGGQKGSSRRARPGGFEETTSAICSQESRHRLEAAKRRLTEITHTACCARLQATGNFFQRVGSVRGVQLSRQQSVSCSFRNLYHP